MPRLLYVLPAFLIIVSSLIIFTHTPIPPRPSETSGEAGQPTTNNWLTYESTQFSLKYPRELEIGNVRNAMVFFNGSAHDKPSKYFFGLSKPDFNTQIEPISETVIDGKPAYLRKVVVDNKGYPTDNIRHVSIENVRFYQENQWHNDGVLFIAIHIDGDPLNAEAVSNKIIRTIAFRDLDQTDDPMVVKVNNLELQIPYTWWYECKTVVPDSWIHKKLGIEIDQRTSCKIDTQSNRSPDRPPHFFLNFYPVGSRVPPLMAEKLLKNVKRENIIISGTEGVHTQGIVDPIKYSEGSAVYGPNDQITSVELKSPEGTYILSGVTTSKDLKELFNRILSTFKFLEK